MKFKMILTGLLALSTSSCVSTIPQSVSSESSAPSSLSTLQNQISQGSVRLSPNEKVALFLMKDPQKISQEQIFTFDLTTQKIQRKTFVFGRVFDADFKSDSEILFLSNTDLIKERPRYLYPQNHEQNSGDVYLLSEISQPRLRRLTNTGTEKDFMRYMTKNQKTADTRALEEKINQCLRTQSLLSPKVICVD